MSKPTEVCELCGGKVTAADKDARREDLSIGGAMCPTPMTFHAECYEKASEVWKPDEDSTCTVDPEFPETQRWTAYQKLRGGL